MSSVAVDTYFNVVSRLGKRFGKSYIMMEAMVFNLPEFLSMADGVEIKLIDDTVSFRTQDRSFLVGAECVDQILFSYIKYGCTTELLHTYERSKVSSAIPMLSNVFLEGDGLTRIWTVPEPFRTLQIMASVFSCLPVSSCSPEGPVMNDFSGMYDTLVLDIEDGEVIRENFSSNDVISSISHAATLAPPLTSLESCNEDWTGNGIFFPLAASSAIYGQKYIPPPSVPQAAESRVVPWIKSGLSRPIGPSFGLFKRCCNCYTSSGEQYQKGASLLIGALEKRHWGDSVSEFILKHTERLCTKESKVISMFRDMLIDMDGRIILGLSIDHWNVYDAAVYIFKDRRHVCHTQPDELAVIAIEGEKHTLLTSRSNGKYSKYLLKAGFDTLAVVTSPRMTEALRNYYDPCLNILAGNDEELKEVPAIRGMDGEYFSNDMSLWEAYMHLPFRDTEPLTTVVSYQGLSTVVSVVLPCQENHVQDEYYKLPMRYVSVYLGLWGVHSWAGNDWTTVISPINGKILDIPADPYFTWLIQARLQSLLFAPKEDVELNFDENGRVTCLVLMDISDGQGHFINQPFTVVFHGVNKMSFDTDSITSDNLLTGGFLDSTVRVPGPYKVIWHSRNANSWFKRYE